MTQKAMAEVFGYYTFIGRLDLYFIYNWILGAYVPIHRKLARGEMFSTHHLPVGDFYCCGWVCCVRQKECSANTIE